ncbi:deoxyribose-phosphate aldolase [Corynebacterium mycetoides]|uniref:Deoxyribose-phosphate aldolase n=1 Tax=Corynebacterium mycetoides TaxID=38302 RepID=A0A1G9Q957_9CORY|nr:hypothetical protein [Corynebacterium mycetoides]SDM07489.1 deoxyribose-phosphate aldolase [Corynebacterium mycetoides]
MDDLQWLATRTGESALGGQPFASDGRHLAGVVVEPTRVRAANSGSVPVIAVVGWPGGRHHSVIKAAEARLAVDMGADEVWLVVDPGAEGDNEVLADVVAVRQAVDAPVRLGVFYRGCPEVVRAGELAGADTLVCEDADDLPDTSLTVALIGVDDSVDAVVAALDRGAAYAFTGVATARQSPR